VHFPTAAYNLEAAGAVGVGALDKKRRSAWKGVIRLAAPIAYYLIHSMGRGDHGDFSERERRADANFARMAKREGVEQVVYLGGLGEPASKHLRSRQQTAKTLSAEGPPLTYFRAGMVVGSHSESFRTLYYLVKRLPAMITPSWLRTRTQPIGIDDVIGYLSAAPRTSASRGRKALREQDEEA
jgi:uncharacterized protein YbjT (DUF2867 family)